MQLKHLVAVALIGSMLWQPARASAQQTAPGEPDMWRTMVTRLEPAALVEVRLKDGSHFKGTVLRADADGFAIKPRTRIPVPAREIAFDDVVSIERTTSSMSPAKKVLLGVGIGAGVYMVVVALLFAAIGYD